ncbi:hypothetical protein [Bradyrhizobium sp. UFLA05-109]
MRQINNARDAADAQSDLAAAVSAGDITPADAVEISKVPANAAKAHDIADAVTNAELVRQCSDADLYRIIERERVVEYRGRLPGLLTDLG